MFLDQEARLKNARPNETDFDGDWKPDEDELLVLDNSDEVTDVVNAAIGNAVALPRINTTNFENEQIKALITCEGAAGAERLLIQRFTGQQLLRRKRAYLLDGNNFRELDEAAFTLGSSITCIVEDGELKFDSYHNLRAIFDVVDFYEEATDADIDTIAAHASINIPDVDGFKDDATQTIRKLVHKVMNSGVLDAHTSQEIHDRAADTGLTIDLINGVLQVPDDKALARQFFRFLDDSLYEAALSGQRYVTNSKRAI
ncbi:hypothetical protein [Parvularcula marina]|uniref:hypothetical protein n=1 Tax=Parvularcula marina TaxID=2292771 RepID=UPI003559E072